MSIVVRRLACVDLPSFPLQLLVRRHPEWRDLPSAVVTQDTPQGEILQINRAARRAGILPGQLYASALSLCTYLRAGTVTDEDVNSGVELVARRLDRFTPSVEAVEGEPGVFVADASGLERLHETPVAWGEAVSGDLEEVHLKCTVAVGFTRFGSYALARSRRGVIVPDDPAAEAAAARGTSLEHMGLPSTVRDDLFKLGVRTVGQLLELPPGGLLERFGPGAHRLFHMAAGTAWCPIDPRRFPDPPVRRAQLDFPDSDSTRLLFLAKRLIAPLLREVADRGEALAELQMKLDLDHAPDRSESISPAAPTLDQPQILDLVRLRLESMNLEAGVVEMTLFARTVTATVDQLRLFREHAGRDPEAADRAFARIKARFGHDSVVRARLVDGHLPEASFRWEPLPPTPPSEQVFPRAAGAKRESESPRQSTLIRRIFEKPIPMNTRPVCGPSGVHLRGLEHEPVVKVTGPYIISGGWWHREQHREYHFAQTADGQIMWVYFDRSRRRWYLHGTVE